MAAGQNPPINGDFIDNKEDYIRQTLIAAVENRNYLKSLNPTPIKAYKRAKEEVEYLKGLLINERQNKLKKDSRPLY